MTRRPAAGTTDEKPRPIFVETSALAAIALEEPGWGRLAERLLDGAATTTCVNLFEAALAIARERALTVVEAYEFARELAERLDIAVSDYPAEAIAAAAAARDRFGAGRYGLNLGDCLSYAAAKRLGARMLFVGEDFARTDVDRAD